MTFAAQAHQAIIRTLREYGTVRPSDVWPSIKTQPKDPRALGGVFRQLHRDGFIKPHGFTNCGRGVRHNGIERIWVRGMA